MATNFIKTFLLGVAVLSATWLVSRCDEYTTDARVYSTNSECVCFVTNDGNLWELICDDTSTFVKGDLYFVTFKQYENDNLYDDTIVKVKAKGEK